MDEQWFFESHNGFNNLTAFIPSSAWYREGSVKMKEIILVSAYGVQVVFAQLSGQTIAHKGLLQVHCNMQVWLGQNASCAGSGTTNNRTNAQNVWGIYCEDVQLVHQEWRSIGDINDVLSFGIFAKKQQTHMPETRKPGISIFNAL